jgi:hypothetical protein
MEERNGKVNVINRICNRVNGDGNNVGKYRKNESNNNRKYVGNCGKCGKSVKLRN